MRSYFLRCKNPFFFLFIKLLGYCMYMVWDSLIAAQTAVIKIFYGELYYSIIFLFTLIAIISYVNTYFLR